MSLSAMNASFDLMNPSNLIERGASKADVCFVTREMQREEGKFFCPHCYRKTQQLIPVTFRSPENRRPHFYHASSSDGGECSNHSGESEKHLNAKAALIEELKAAGLGDATLEVKLQIHPGLPWRRPDITVTYPNGAVEVHEIQISPITSEELAARTKDLRAHGASKVVWYLYAGSYSAENRLWGKQAAVDVRRLWFKDKEFSAIGHELDTSTPQSLATKAVNKSNPYDGCGFRPGDLFSVNGQVLAVEKRTRDDDGNVLVYSGGKTYQPSAITPVEPVRHKRKEGFVGYVYSTPWGLPTFRDVTWVLPERGGDPVRYSVNDLVFDEAAEAIAA